VLEIGSEGATLLVGVAAVLAVGWGALLSVRSAVRGPAWALGHLSQASRVVPIALLVGTVAVFLVRPLWVGFAWLYIGGLVWWLSGLLRRNLVRLEAAGAFAEVPFEARVRIVRRARTMLLIGGGLLLALGLAAFSQGATAWVTAVLGAVLLLTAGAIRAEDRTGPENGAGRP
jgi:hypothetical protein